jgi:hypothetical protein
MALKMRSAAVDQFGAPLVGYSFSRRRPDPDHVCRELIRRRRVNHTTCVGPIFLNVFQTAHNTTRLTNYFRVRRFLFADITAESLRSMWSSRRGPPAKSTQRFPLTAPHVGQGTDICCFLVKSLFFVSEVIAEHCNEAWSHFGTPLGSPCRKRKHKVDAERVLREGVDAGLGCKRPPDLASPVNRGGRYASFVNVSIRVGND